MSAANQTWTIDVAGQKYIDKDMNEHIVTANSTVKFNFTDDGTGGRFVGEVGSNLVCTDGFRVTISTESRFEFVSSADGSATFNNGSVAFVEETNALHEHRIISLTLADADAVGANNITSITFESVLTGRQFTWVTIDTA